MSTIEESIKEMNLKRVKIYICGLSSQKYNQDVTATYKKIKTIFGKRYDIDLYDECRSNTPQDHIYIYDRGI